MNAEEGRLDEAGRRLFDYVAWHEARLRLLFAARRGIAVEREVRAAVEARVLASRGFRPPADNRRIEGFVCATAATTPYDVGVKALDLSNGASVLSGNQ